MRSARIRQISAVKRRAYYERHLCSEAEVLFEHQENGAWVGYTGNYVRVAVRSNENLENELRVVRIEELAGDYAMGSVFEKAEISS